MKRKRFVTFKVDNICSGKKREKFLMNMNEEIDIFIIIIFVILFVLWLHVVIYNKIFLRLFIYCIFPQSLRQRMQ